ncbi:OPT superfamily oligopeptide transporter [Stipitochalara longipes BDJ]|nr:OPT superfamily oligopeptide transporter [Stipitochalara longipes BDJ]
MVTKFHQRPGFTRTDTDKVSRESDQPIQSACRDSEKTYDRKSDITYVGDELPAFDAAKEDHFGEAAVLTDAKDVLTHVIHVDDGPSLSPWTFRAFFLGIALAIFASVLQEIYYFKPQAIYVSIVFMTVIGYALGELMSFIPRIGAVGHFLNPFPFNSKEHAFIIIMASTAATIAVSTEILAAQRLYYNMDPNAGAAIFLVISSQLLGFGIAGLLRSVLVQPTRETRFRLKIFWIVFGILLVWEIIPEWIFPVLQGVSIFCLAKQNSLLFTNLFGGSSGNEGLGFLSVSFDWQYIASLGSPMWLPLYALTNSTIGYLLCTVLFMGIYYGNIWESQNFPFLSQLLYDNSSNSTSFSPYNLTGFAFLSPTNLAKLVQPSFWMFWKGGKSRDEHQREVLENPDMDPHYKLMVQSGYSEVPNWWYGMVLLTSFIMVAGYIHPGKPLANMYFTVFGFNGVQQGQWLCRDLKIAQLVHLSPKSTFTAQRTGEVIGAIFNYIMMKTIVTNQFEILTSIEGSNIWSGQNVQQYSTLAIAWSIAGDMFSIGARYQWVTIAYLIGFIVLVPFWLIYRYTKIEFFNYINLSIILWYMGTQVIVFILSFAVLGGGGVAHDFPTWGGNNGGVGNGKNVDYCMYNPANG